jgi:hypothetical protein
MEYVFFGLAMFFFIAEFVFFIADCRCGIFG